MKKALFNKSKPAHSESSDDDAADEREETNGLFELWPATPEGEVPKIKTTIE